MFVLHCIILYWDMLYNIVRHRSICNSTVQYTIQFGTISYITILKNTRHFSHRRNPTNLYQSRLCFNVPGFGIGLRTYCTVRKLWRCSAVAQMTSHSNALSCNQKTVWPSGLRRWLKALVRKGVGSNPTAVNALWRTPCYPWFGSDVAQKLKSTCFCIEINIFKFIYL